MCISRLVDKEENFLGHENSKGTYVILGDKLPTNIISSFPYYNNNLLNNHFDVRGPTRITPILGFSCCFVFVDEFFQIS